MTKLKFNIPPNKFREAYGLLEADDTPECDITITKVAPCREDPRYTVQISTSEENADYFRKIFA